jgi:hypothetical protein
VRIAFEDIVDQAPPAPAWSDAPGPRLLERIEPRPAAWLVFAGVAAVVILAVAGAALLLGDRRQTEQVGGSSTSIGATTAPPVVPTTATPADEFDITHLVGRIDASTSLPGFGPDLLTDGDVNSAWNDDSRRGEGATLTLSFVEPVHVDRIVLFNIANRERRTRNARIRSVVIRDGDSGAQRAAVEVADSPEAQAIAVDQVFRGPLVIEVTGVYPAETFTDRLGDRRPPFEELALAEIVVVGRPLERALDTEEMTTPGMVAGVFTTLPDGRRIWASIPVDPGSDLHVGDAGTVMTGDGEVTEFMVSTVVDGRSTIVQVVAGECDLREVEGETAEQPGIGTFVRGDGTATWCALDGSLTVIATGSEDFIDRALSELRITEL